MAPCRRWTTGRWTTGPWADGLGAAGLPVQGPPHGGRDRRSTGGVRQRSGEDGEGRAVPGCFPSDPSVIVPPLRNGAPPAHTRRVSVGPPGRPTQRYATNPSRRTGSRSLPGPRVLATGAEMSRESEVAGGRSVATRRPAHACDASPPGRSCRHRPIRGRITPGGGRDDQDGRRSPPSRLPKAWRVANTTAIPQPPRPRGAVRGPAQLPRLERNAGSGRSRKTVGALRPARTAVRSGAPSPAAVHRGLDPLPLSRQRPNNCTTGADRRCAPCVIQVIGRRS